MLDLEMEDTSRDYSECLEIILAQPRAAALVNCQVEGNISLKSSKHPNLGCPGQHGSALRHTVLGPRHSCQAPDSRSQHWAEEQVRGGSNCWNTSIHHGDISQHIMSEGTLLLLLEFSFLTFCISVGGQSNQPRLQDYI